ncbi:cytidylyltransferase domain-containing protein [Hymenobacter sp. B81]|uniref:cytidylyltransferase domain-containing protein n=1 Tax=Hymenobacter sp. B81 TaxID=3344878 RepID=UPI0037DCDC03
MDHSLSPAPRTGALVQARLGSTRLPGKVLLPLPLEGNLTVLDQVLARVGRVPQLSTVVVATSSAAADDALAATAEARGAAVFRGSEQDVLGRFYHAATAFGLDVVVRLTADNPALDPHYLTQALAHHLRSGADYTLTTGLPLGTNLEVISYAALAAAHTQAQRPEEREHVTPYLRRHPNAFRLETLAFEPLLPDLRLTLDYASDYALLHLLYTSLPAGFGLREVQLLLAQHPWLAAINGSNQQVSP